MRQPPSPSVMLTGTDQPVEPPRLLTAGKLTAELESGRPIVPVQLCPANRSGCAQPAAKIG